MLIAPETHQVIRDGFFGWPIIIIYSIFLAWYLTRIARGVIKDLQAQRELETKLIERDRKREEEVWERWRQLPLSQQKKPLA